MSLTRCRTCADEIAEDAPICPRCGAPHPGGTYPSQHAWSELATSFGRLTGSTFVALLLWSAIPVLIWIIVALTIGASLRGM